MALLTSHSAVNRVVDTALVVTYSCSRVSGMWSYTSGNVSGYYTHMYELHRRARKSYRYVGMTESAAQTCKAAMVALYTRSFKVSDWDDTSMGGGWSDVSAGSMVMADVAMNHNDDGSYDVVVNVNEDDMRMRAASSSNSYDTIFSAERLRSYDGEAEAVATGGSD